VYGPPEPSPGRLGDVCAPSESSPARRGGGQEPLGPSPDSRRVDVNLDTPFQNAPAFRATALLAQPGFTDLFRPRVVSTTLAVAWVAAGRRAAYVTDGRQHDSATNSPPPIVAGHDESHRSSFR
jgi:hypothetical protein